MNKYRIFTSALGISVLLVTVCAGLEPSVTTSGGATNVGVGTATLQGLMTAGGAATAYFCWGAEEGTRSGASTGTWDHVSDAIAISYGVAFSNVVSNLYYGIKYDFAIYATNGNGEAWSSATNFTTAVPTTWTPADMTTAAWYDGADTDTLWADSVGGTKATTTIAWWEDKSGNSKHLSQLTGGSQPDSAASAIGGKHAVSFNGTSDYIYTSTGLGADIRSLFLIMKSDAAVTSSSAAILPVSSYGDEVSTGVGLGGTTGAFNNEVLTVLDEDEPNTYVDRQGVSSTKLPSINTAAHVYSFVLGSDWHIGFDGSADLRDLSSGSRHALGFTDSFSVGAGVRKAPTEITGYLNGSIGEIICLSSSADTEDQAKLEGYLAHKWGLQGNLPGDHQYKTDAPTGGAAALFGIDNTFATNETQSTADLLGSLDATQSVFTVSAYWSTSNNTSEAQWLVDNTASNAVFGTYTNVTGQSLSNTVSSLEPGTTYYFTYMASNAVTNIWADGNVAFTTLSNESAPGVTTAGGATDIGVGIASLRAELTNGGVADVYICWGADAGNTSSTSSWDNVVFAGALVDGDVGTTAVSGLLYGVAYSYVVYATNSVDSAWSSVTNFVTAFSLASGGDEVYATNDINGVNWTVHKFTTVGERTLTLQRDLTVDYLIVGGGGGGGGHIGGGGGAGGLITSVVDVDVSIAPQASIDVAPGTYSVTVGAGGTGGSGDGEDSILALGGTTLTALGGGGGGDWDKVGRNGGSGGGGGAHYNPGSATQPAGGFGNDGAPKDSDQYAGGGGGGAGAVPGATLNGGAGLTFDITGSEVGYAGGGGGGRELGSGGAGIATHGGGAGGKYNVSAPAPGVANTGGGGGGRGSWKDGSPAENNDGHTWSTAAGGSGIVVVRYRTPVIIANTDATNVGASSADLGGILDCEDSVYTVYAYWSTNSWPDAGEWTSAVANGTAFSKAGGTYTNVPGQAVTISVENLASATPYYYTLMATNAATTIWASPNKGFTTKAVGSIFRFR